MQEKKSYNLISSIGINNVTISGDTRFDSVISNTKNSIDMPLIDMFSKLFDVDFFDEIDND